MADTDVLFKEYNAYIKKFGKEPPGSNQFHKFAKIKYNIAKFQYNYHAKLKKTQQPIYHGSTYDLKKELIKLKEKYKNNYKDIPQRKMVDGMSDPSSNAFTIMQYSITTDTIIKKNNNDAKSDEYNDPVNWGYRGYKILQEIEMNKPDIICIQELNHYYVNIYIFVSEYIPYIF